MVDDDYQSFIASLSAEAPTEQESTAVSTTVQASDGPTPLIAALLAEKAAQRDKEVITRYHSHYQEEGKRKHVERLQREKAEEARDFNRSSSLSADAAAERPGKPRPQTPTEGGPSKKRHPAARPPPQSPSKGSKLKDGAGRGADIIADGQGGPQKPRPKFKFDSVIPASGGSSTPPTGLPSGAPVRRPGVHLASGGGDDDMAANDPVGASRRAKQRQKAKDKEKDKRPGVTNDESTPATALPPKAAPVILQRPARIDDDPAPSSSGSPAVGPTASVPRGAARGGRGGRGRGRGGGDVHRGGVPSSHV